MLSLQHLLWFPLAAWVLGGSGACCWVGAGGALPAMEGVIHRLALRLCAGVKALSRGAVGWWGGGRLGHP